MAPGPIRLPGEAQARTRTRYGPARARVRVELLTDPWSVWCWGFEPVRRALELRHPRIEFQFLLGGMFPRMPDHAAVGFQVDRFFGVVQRTTGMPIEATRTIREDPADSTYPACTFVHAVRLLQPDREKAYLRALREALYLDGLNISRPEVGARVAARVGLDAAAFKEKMDSGEPEEAFHRAIANLQARQLHSYPTLLLTHEDRTARVEGFQSLPAVLALVENLLGEPSPLLPDPHLNQVIPVGERVTTREAAEVLGLSVERAADALAEHAASGILERQRFPTGDAWVRVRDDEDRPVVRLW